MRRRYLLAVAAAGTVGGTIAWRWAQEPPATPPPRSPASQAVSLGPVPLALPDEPSPPAHLTGRIESIEPEWDNREGNSLFDGPGGNQTVVREFPPVVPPSLPIAAGIDEPAWRPSPRTEEDKTPRAEGTVGTRSQVATYRIPVATASTPAPPSTESSPSLRATKTVLHRIADGDTLTSLAARYLGSASRWPEIFAANRDRLSNPEILPIKTELRIVVPKTMPDQTGGP